MIAPGVVARLEAKVDRSGGPDACWPFTGGAATRSGHRQMWADGQMRLAHRLAYEHHHGPIPDGLCVCHACDNPRCCNPAHLWLGTVADNNTDRDRKGRQVSTPGTTRRYASPGPINHGTIYAYIKRKCRCDACREAIRLYRNRDRDRPAHPRPHSGARRAGHRRQRPRPVARPGVPAGPVRPGVR